MLFIGALRILLEDVLHVDMIVMGMNSSLLTCTASCIEGHYHHLAVCGVVLWLIEHVLGMPHETGVQALATAHVHCSAVRLSCVTCWHSKTAYVLGLL